MDEKDLYPTNSFKSREPQNDLPQHKEMVAKGTRKKETIFRKFVKEWIPLPDTAETMEDFLVKDVAAPGLKNLLYSLATNALSFFLFHNADKGAAPKSNNGVGKISYREYYTSTNAAGTSNSSRSSISQGYLYPDTCYETRGDAEIVLETMRDVVEKYGIVTMADMFELSGLVTQPGDFKFGWTKEDMPNASIERLRDGTYTIKMSRAKPID